MSHTYEDGGRRPLKDRTVHPHAPATERRRTDQSAFADTDINRIMRQVVKTGVMPPNTRQAVFGDFRATDFQQAQNLMVSIRLAFGRLDARTRAQFDNDPRVMLEWLENPDNGDKAREMGLLPPLRKPKADPVGKEAPPPSKEAPTPSSEPPKADPEANPRKG